MYISFHVIYPLFLSHFNENWIFETDFKTSNIKFSENSSSVSRVVSFVRSFVRTDGRTDGHRDRQRDRHYAANTRLSKFCKR